MKREMRRVSGYGEKKWQWGLCFIGFNENGRERSRGREEMIGDRKRLLVGEDEEDKMDVEYCN